MAYRVPLIDESTGQLPHSVVPASVPLGALMRPRAAGPVPGVTVTQSAASGYGAPESVLWDDPLRLSWPAGRPVAVTPATPYNPGCRLLSTGGQNQQSNYLSFLLLGDSFELHSTVWATTDLVVYIDGVAATATPTLIADQAGGTRFVRFVGISTGMHRIDVILGWGANLIQVVIGPGAHVLAAPDDRLRVGCFGDSYVDSGIAPHYRGWCGELARQTGWTVVPLGQGSTGPTTDGGGAQGRTRWGSPARLAAIAAARLDLLFCVGTVNTGDSTSAVLGAAMTEFFGAVDVPTIALGVEPIYDAGNPSASAAWDAANAAIIGAARAASSVIAVIDWRAPEENWLTGEGCVSAPAGDGGNQDFLIGDVAGTDTIHPNADGHAYLVGRLVERIRSVRLPI